MFRKPKVFNDDQWEIVIKIRALRLFSKFAESFGPVFFLLYIMQHISMDQQSMQRGISTAVLAISAYVFAVPYVKKHIDKWVMPLTIIGCAVGLICNYLIIEHPVIVVFIMAILVRSVGFFQDKGFGKVMNRCFKGDAKTEFSYIREQMDSLAVIAASFACWLCADLPLLYIVIVDSILSIIDVWFTWSRFRLLTRYLEKHPYQEKEED